MRQGIVLIALLLAACSAVDVQPDVNVSLEQVDIGGDLRLGGPIFVKYRVWASNATELPITLDRIEIRTIGPGAYTLQEANAIPVKLTIPSKQGMSAVISARAFAPGGNMQSSEPVTVRATAYFSTPGGKSFVRIFNQNFRE